MRLTYTKKSPADVARTLPLEKTAMAYALSDNVQTWPSELTAALFKDHPWLGKFNVNLDIKQQDEGAGYLYGAFVVAPADAAPPAPGAAGPVGQFGAAGPAPQDPYGMGAQQAAPGVGLQGGGMPKVGAPMGPAIGPPPVPPPETGAPPAGDQAPAAGTNPNNVAVIPVIVKAKRVFPMDTYIDRNGKFMPLTEARVQRDVYRSLSDFQAVPAEGMEQALQQQSTNNMNSGFPGSSFGDDSFNRGLNKMSAAQGSVLDRLDLDTEKVAAVLGYVSADEGLVDVASRGLSFGQGLARLRDRASAIKTATAESAAYGESLDGPSILVKVGGGFEVRTLDATFSLGNAEAFRHMPHDILRETTENGSSVLVGGSGLRIKTAAKKLKPKEVEDAGLYNLRVKTGSAQYVEALVLPGNMGYAIFGPDGCTYQNELVGEKLAGVDPDAFLTSMADLTISSGRPHTLVYKDVDKLKYAGVYSRVALYNGSVYELVNMATGEHVLAEKTAAVRAPVLTGNNLLVPENAVWVPVDSSAYAYAGSTHEFGTAPLTKTAKLERVHGEYYLSEEGAAESQPMSEADALLLLAALGDDNYGAREKIAAAAKHPVEFLLPMYPGSRTKTAAVSDSPAVATVQVDHLVPDSGLLMKIAAAMDGIAGDTVDMVLSMGFMTPENIDGYLEIVPDIEATVSKLSELLIGARLGLPDVPEPAVKAAVSGMERTLLGLQKLQIRNQADRMGNATTQATHAV